MWTEITRRQHSRAGLRYPSDLRDAEWCLIEPLFPPARRGGRPRATDLREVLNAILYLATSGCQWRMLPKDFPPLSTVQRYFYAWRNSGLLATINQLLVMTARQQMGREASPTQLEQRVSKMRFCSMRCARRRKCYHYIFGVG